MGGETPEFRQVAKEFSDLSEKLADPVVVGALLNRLGEERREANDVLHQILGRFEALERSISSLEQRLAMQLERRPAGREEVLLSDVDRQLLAFVRSQARVCAEDCRIKFNYKNKNAASARLNALWKQGVLEKKFAGKTAYFELSSR